MDYVLIGCLLIGFLYGINRGFLRSVTYLITIGTSFVLAIKYRTLIGDMINSFVDLNNIYLKVSKFLDMVGINQEFFNFIITVILPFILAVIIISLLLNTIFFRKRNSIMKVQKGNSKFLGSIIGLINGFVLYVVLLFILPGLFEINIGKVASYLYNHVQVLYDIVSLYSKVVL